MGLETATFIDQLDGTNPPGTDLKSQGDDHLRLIKNVLKNSIKRVTRAFYVPTGVAKSSNYVAAATDDNTTFICSTGGGNFTITMPTLFAADAGWCCYIQKTTTDANAVFIAPPSGTINGFTKVRRSVEFLITKVLWNWTGWVASRASGLPIGSSIPFHGATLPNGCLWPDGATFTAADYVELNSVLGGNTKPDLRGRAPIGKDNMGGSAANRVTNAGSGITGTTLGATGGGETVTLTAAQLATHDHNTVITDPGHHHTVSVSGFGGPVGGGGQAAFSGSTNTSTDGTGISIAVNDSGKTRDQAHNNMPPSIISNYVLIAE